MHSFTADVMQPPYIRRLAMLRPERRKDVGPSFVDPTFFLTVSLSMANWQRFPESSFFSTYGQKSKIHHSYLKPSDASCMHTCPHSRCLQIWFGCRGSHHLRQRVVLLLPFSLRRLATSCLAENFDRCKSNLQVNQIGY